MVSQRDITHPHSRGETQWLRAWHKRKRPRRNQPRRWRKSAPTRLPRRGANRAVASAIPDGVLFARSIDVRQRQAAHVDGCVVGPRYPAAHVSSPGHFFLYTFSPTFSSRFGMVTFPSVEAMIVVFPEAEGPNSLDRSTLIVNVVPSTVISTFFMMIASQWWTESKDALSEWWCILYRARWRKSMNRIATRETGGNARQAQTGLTRHASPAPCACRAPEL